MPSRCALIPARAGSKGLPGKNSRLLAGHPLLAWSILAARHSACFDCVAVSSDDTQLLAIGEQYGADVLIQRPDELASDEASSVDVALHALDQMPDSETLMLLQPTSPLRTADDIRHACALHQQHGTGCVSVSPAKPPAWMTPSQQPARWPAHNTQPGQRQQQQAHWVLNGAIYLLRCAALRRERHFLLPGMAVHVMPRSRSVDIDDADDWLLAEALMHHIPHPDQPHPES